MTMRQLKAAIIGAGHFACRVHIPVLAGRAEVELDSVCRRDAEELEIVQQEFEFTFATQDWRSILDREIDIAVIATPHHLHFEQAAAFLDKGCHVLVEKPMCLDPRQAWELVAKAQTNGVNLVVAHGWHYKPKLKQARELIGQIGKIEHVLCHMASFTRNVFSGDGSVGKWKNLRIQPQAETWQDPDFGGGYAYGQLSHALGLLYWMTELRAHQLQATTFNSDRGIDLHDSALVRFCCGATGSISGSCAIPDGHGFELDIRIYGEFGVFGLDLEREMMTLKLGNGQLRTVSPTRGQWQYSCEGPANALVDLALGKGRNESDGVIGARTVETLSALTKSARNGGASQPVDHAPVVEE